MSNSKVLPLAETAIIAALTYVLSLFTINIANSFYLEFAVIPVIFLALRRGIKWGLTAGLLYGLLILVTGQGGNMALGNPLLQYSDGVIEYILAPASLGIAGVFTSKKLTLPTVIWATLITALVKYFFHFIAGGLFWASYAPKGWNFWLFSLWSQGLSGLITAGVAVVVLILLYKITPKLFTAK